jgi:maltose O-acetyltransferase
MRAGSRFYANVGCVILDCNTVDIGDGVLFGPYVQVYTAFHPTNPAARLSKCELAAPIRVGNNVWIGGGAIILPGVNIGDNTTIGAGSVVAADLPDNVVASGNPCAVKRFVK